MPAAAFALSIPFYVAGVHTSSWALALVLLSVPFAFYATYLPPALAIVQNRVAPTQRSTAASIHLLVMSLIGLGGGPLFIGAISDATDRAGGHAPLQIAMFALAPVFALAALLHVAVAR